MPRDSAGNYSLVSGNPVQSGEVISSSWANNTMDDVAVALSDSLDRNGRGGMLAPFRFADGSNLLPGAAWVNETSTGFYRFDGGDLRVAVLTQDVMRWQTSGVQIWNDTDSQWEQVVTGGNTGTQVPVNIGTVQGQTLRWDETTTKEWQATSVLIVDDAGNVGIGTPTPTRKLEVDGTGKFTGTLAATFVGSLASPSLQLGDNAATGLFTPSNSVIAITNNGSESMRIDSAGNVGINDATPDLKLTINSGQVSLPTLHGGLALQATAGNTGDALPGIGWAFTGGTGSYFAALDVLRGSGSGGDFVFRNQGITNYADLGESMRITNAGNVGIGTATPTANLEILYAAGTLVTQPAEIKLSNNATAFADDSAYIGFSGRLTGAFRENVAHRVGVKGTSLVFNYGGTGWNDGTERMRIDSTGNVGIGTSTPLYVLSVESAGNAAAFIDSPANRYCSVGFGSAGVAKWWMGRYDSDVGSADSFFIGADGGNATDPGGLLAKMTIDSAGNLLVGRTSLSLGAEGVYISPSGAVQCDRAGAGLISNRTIGNGTVAQFYISNATSGQITTTSGGTPSFAAGSDIALKDNVTDIGGELANIMALRPVDYTLKASGEEGSGFIAQEVQDIWPHKVLVNDDDEYLSLCDMGDTTARLVKAIQELTARLEVLENG